MARRSSPADARICARLPRSRLHTGASASAVAFRSERFSPLCGERATGTVESFTPMPLSSGTRLGPYEIVAAIGAGGMGEVYRARDTRLGRDVALKILPAEVANDPSRRQRFELEARAVAALNHPSIVAVYDVGKGYIVSELVEGQSLRGANLGLRKTIEVAMQIASGLAAAHDAGIVHRDLKPANIMLTRDGRPKILDFG